MSRAVFCKEEDQSIMPSKFYKWLLNILKRSFSNICINSSYLLDIWKQAENHQENDYFGWLLVEFCYESGASNGLLMIPSKTFDVYGTNKKNIFVRGPKLGPWAQFQICYKMSNMTRYWIFKEIWVCHTKSAMAWSLFDQMTSILLQMKAND